jgi:hypothetical protein
VRYHIAPQSTVGIGSLCLDGFTHDDVSIEPRLIAILLIYRGDTDFHEP